MLHTLVHPVARSRQELPLIAAAVALVTALLCALAQPALAQEPGSVTGRVTAAGDPVAEATATLVDLRRRLSVVPDGTFRFDDVPPGEHILEASSRRYGTAVERVTVEPGATARVELAFELARHSEEIVVTASPEARSQLDLAQPTAVLSGDELSLRLQPTLGETLSAEPGVSSTYFGPGASRPVIRGLGGDRVRMLQGGLGTGDVSTTSPDHAVTVDPGSAERIEVVRGPATLLYGSSAIGGVVNVLDERIPDFRPTRGLEGTVDLTGGTVADERSAAVGLTGGSGPWAWHLEGLKRETGDYAIPGFAQVEGAGHDEDNPYGTLPNSDLEATSAGLGGTYFFGDRAFLGLAVSGHDTNYGVPGAGEGEEGGTRIDMQQRRYDLRGEVTRPFGAFRGLKVRLGATDYEHSELEATGDVGTTFFNDSWEGRAELVQKPWHGISGSFGVQVRRRDLEAVGEEAFIPEASSLNLGVFAFQELTRGPVSYQFGLRYETQDTNTSGPGLPDRSFDGLSASLGAVWRPVEGYSVGASLARAVKMPNGEELYSEGPHFATQAFEMGDPGLDEETSLGLDLSLRKETGRLTGTLTLFANRFDDFIFESFTGEEEDGLPVLQFSQDDAEFRGAELEVRAEVYEADTAHVDLRLFGDYVEAELSASGEPLPRIPPMRYGAGLDYHGDRLLGTLEIRRVARQDRVAPEETPTAGYTLVNAAVGYRFFIREQVLDVLLRGTNLTDQEARNHLSFLKDSVPLPGRDVGLSLRLSF